MPVIKFKISVLFGYEAGLPLGYLVVDRRRETTGDTAQFLSSVGDLLPDLHDYHATPAC